MSNLTISAVIPTKNRVSLLKRTLDVLLQDDYPHKEIVVSDDASTDGTRELLESYGDAVRWVSEPNGGEYDSRNRGMSLASGEIFRYLSDDDVPVAGAFACAADHFDKHPETDLLFGQGDLYYTRYGLEPVLFEKRVCTAQSVTLRNFIRQAVPTPFSETAFFRRSVLDRVGPFRLDYPGADMEFWARIAKAGLRIAVTPEKFVDRYLSDLSVQVRLERAMALQGLRIAREHGTLSDWLYVAFAKVLPALVVMAARKPLHFLGIYPTKRRAAQLMREQAGVASDWRSS